MNIGWIKVHRRWLEHPRYTDDGWMHLYLTINLLANHSLGVIRRIFGGKEIVLKPGQLITSRDSLSKQTGMHASKVERLLKKFEIEQLIEQQSDNKSRLITITYWNSDQFTEQQSELPSNTNRTATEHTQEWKNGKKEKKENNTSGEAGSVDSLSSKSKKLTPDQQAVFDQSLAEWRLLYLEIFGDACLLTAADEKCLTSLVRAGLTAERFTEVARQAMSIHSEGVFEDFYCKHAVSLRAFCSSFMQIEDEARRITSYR